ncbi:hypothetical protein OROMI_008108 [Orobanche minor]
MNMDEASEEVAEMSFRHSRKSMLEVIKETVRFHLTKKFPPHNSLKGERTRIIEASSCRWLCIPR